jgi:hypothetical protein
MMITHHKNYLNQYKLLFIRKIDREIAEIHNRIYNKMMIITHKLIILIKDFLTPIRTVIIQLLQIQVKTDHQSAFLII